MINVNRLYKGLATVRSDQVIKVLNRRQDLVIECEGEKMTIPYNDIRTSIINKSAPMPSKFNVNTTYELWDFLWMPDNNVHE